MKDISTIIPLLKTSKPVDIFKKLVAFNEAATSQSRRAIVRIGLSSGFILEGTPLKIDADGNAIFTTSNNCISYVNTNQLAGVEILNPEILMEILTEGSYFEVPENVSYTKLELMRRLKALSDSFKNKYGISLNSSVFEENTPTDAEKYQFGQFLTILQNTIEDLAGDSLGKKAIQEVGEIKILSDNKDVSVEKNGKSLCVGINFKNKFASTFQDKLRLALESNL